MLLVGMALIGAMLGGCAAWRLAPKTRWRLAVTFASATAGSVAGPWVFWLAAVILLQR